LLYYILNLVNWNIPAQLYFSLESLAGRVHILLILESRVTIICQDIDLVATFLVKFTLSLLIAYFKY